MISVKNHDKHKIIMKKLLSVLLAVLLVLGIGGGVTFFIIKKKKTGKIKKTEKENEKENK